MVATAISQALYSDKKHKVVYFPNAKIFFNHFTYNTYIRTIYNNQGERTFLKVASMYYTGCLNEMENRPGTTKYVDLVDGVCIKRNLSFSRIEGFCLIRIIISVGNLTSS